MRKLRLFTVVCGAAVFCTVLFAANKVEGRPIREPILEMVNGKAAKALKLAISSQVDNPNDLEILYEEAMAYSQLKDINSAMLRVGKAVEAGLPFERFIAGPRDLFASLTESEQFKEYAKKHPVRLIHGPILGAVTPESARFWVRTALEIPFKVKVSASEQMGDAIASNTVTTSKDRDYTGVVEVQGLKPNTLYYYQLVLDDKIEPIAPQPSFKTYPLAGDKASFKVVFGGGANYVPQYERMWDVILAQQPHAFLGMGDNVYIDFPEVPQIQRYCYYRRQSRPEYRRMTASTPVYAIYDDHDFGDNDCIGGPDIDIPAWKRPVWRLFKENFNNPYYGGGEKQPGCWFEFSIGDVDFFMLDCRYYRTDPAKPNPSMLGPVQKQRLLQKLKASKATFKVIVSSVPWAFGSKPGTQITSHGRAVGSLDTWEGFPDEREEIFGFLDRNKIEGVFLLSADRHRSDACKIDRPNGYAFYEAESSKLTNKHTHKLNPNALFSYNKKCSMGLLAFDTTKPDPEITYQIVTIDNEVIYTLVVKKSQLSFLPPVSAKKQSK